MPRFAVNSRAVFCLLFFVALFLFPSTSTESKYVWNHDIPVSLEIEYHGQSITSVLPQDEQAVQDSDGSALDASEGVQGVVTPSPSEGGELVASNVGSDAIVGERSSQAKSDEGSQDSDDSCGTEPSDEGYGE